MPPILEEEEADIHPMLGVTSGSAGQAQELSSLGSGSNQEKAIVLFKPVNTNPLLHSPSNFSVSVDSNFFSGFKSKNLHVYFFPSAISTLYFPCWFTVFDMRKYVYYSRKLDFF